MGYVYHTAECLHNTAELHKCPSKALAKGFGHMNDLMLCSSIYQEMLQHFKIIHLEEEH